MSEKELDDLEIAQQKRDTERKESYCYVCGGIHEEPLHSPKFMASRAETRPPRLEPK